MENWKKFKKLGQGSYGTVYLACSTSSFAAVKTAGYDQSSSLKNEAAILKELRGNPYVVQCYGEDVSFEEQEEQGRRRRRRVYNLLMEYAPGGTLHDLIRGYDGRTMPESLVALYSYMLLRGLSGIHKKGIVHCDIKPSNVLVFKNRNGSDQLKIADFGVSKYESEEETTMFRTTLAYASPESLECGDHGKATDIWSLGCTVLEMMMNRRSIWSESVCTQDLYDVIIQEGPPEIPEYVSEQGRDFLNKCFQMDAENRWTADMLLDHPFIKGNTNAALVPPPGFEFVTLVQMKNPFGSWSSTKGLFSEKKRSYGGGNRQVFGGVGAAVAKNLQAV